jgi:hypothetical protein
MTKRKKRKFHEQRWQGHVRLAVSGRIPSFPAKERQLFLRLRQLTVDAVRL